MSRRNSRQATPTLITVNPIADPSDNFKGYVCEQIGDHLKIKLRATPVEVRPGHVAMRHKSHDELHKDPDIFLHAPKYLSGIKKHRSARSVSFDYEVCEMGSPTSYRRLKGGNDVKNSNKRECTCSQTPQPTQERKSYTSACCQTKRTGRRKSKVREKTAEPSPRINKKKSQLRMSSCCRASRTTSQIQVAPKQKPAVVQPKPKPVIKPKIEKQERSPRPPIYSMQCCSAQPSTERKRQGTRQCCGIRCVQNQKKPVNNEQTLPPQRKKEKEMKPVPAPAPTPTPKPVPRRQSARSTPLCCCGMCVQQESSSTDGLSSSDCYRPTRRTTCCSNLCTDPSKIYQMNSSFCKNVNDQVQSVKAPPKPPRSQTSNRFPRYKRDSSASEVSHEKVKPTLVADQSNEVTYFDCCCSSCFASKIQEPEKSFAKSEKLPSKRREPTSSGDDTEQSMDQRKICGIPVAEIFKSPNVAKSNSSISSATKLHEGPPYPANCKVLNEMEQQIKMLQDELSAVRKEVLPRQNEARYSKLAKKIHELDALVTDLKRNCLKKQESTYSTSTAQSRLENIEYFVEPKHMEPPNIAKQKKPDVSSTKVNVSESSVGTANDMPSSSSKKTVFHNNILEASPQPQADEGNHPAQNIVSIIPTQHEKQPENNIDKISQNINDDSSICLFCEHKDISTMEKNLVAEIIRLSGKRNKNDIILTILLKDNNLYHINITEKISGQTLGCLFATEQCMIEAKMKNTFEEYLTFFIVDARNTAEEKNKILSHTFEYLKV